MEWAMKAVMILCALAALAMPAHGQAPATPSTSLENAEVVADPVPPELTKSAVEAVGKLGDEVVLGRYQTAIDRMNPLWKKRTAERLGGMETLEKQLKNVAVEMVRQGVSMISFKPQGPPKVFQVWPGTSTAGGQTKLVYTKWMVLVPTVTRFRITPQGAPKPVIIESTGFQVAVREKSGGEWTFIDGANLKPADLRSLFPTLPADIDLPLVEKKQVF